VNDLDAHIRDGLAAAVRVLAEPSVDELAAQLGAARSARPPRPGRRGVGLLAMAAVVAAIVGSIVWVARSTGPVDDVRVTPGSPVLTTTAPTATTTVPSGFTSWGPGWHVIDTGPVPAMYSAVAWTGAQLLVAGKEGAFAYAPAARSWEQLPTPPFGPAAMVWTGDELVAVASSSASSSATLRPGAGAWESAGANPPNPVLAMAGTGAHGPGYRTALFWTGQRVIDATHATVFDPATRRWTVLPMPNDIVRFTALLSTTPVWDGHELVLASPSASPGLAWNATGSSFRELAGAPGDVVPASNMTPQGVAVAAGRNIIFAATGERGPYAVTYDADEGAWSQLPAPSAIGTSEGCPSDIAQVHDRAVVKTCDASATALILDGNAWTSIGSAPISHPGQWLTTGDALVVWASDTDGDRYVEAAVWVP
jgi:hypothetical protein